MFNAREIARACGRVRRAGRGYLIPCPAMGHEDRKPSCTVIDGDHGQPVFHCHAGCDFRDVLAGAEQRGWVDPFQPERRHGRRPCAHSADRALATRRARDRHEAHDRERRQTYARRVWSQAGDPTGSLAEAYLLSRGITATLPPAIRFGSVFEPETRAELPAMVAAVTRWPDPEPCGVHVTFLNSQGGKAKISTPKRLYGPVRGGAVCLADPGEVLGIAEGIESAFSYQQITSTPSWAALSTSGMRAVIVPDHVGLIEVAADQDAPGMKAAHELAHRLKLDGRRVWIAAPHEAGHDFNSKLNTSEVV